MKQEILTSYDNFYRFGFDLGTSSLGVAVYKTDEKGNILSLEHLDSYIFGEPVEPKKMETLNTSRLSSGKSGAGKDFLAATDESIFSYC